MAGCRHVDIECFLSPDALCGVWQVELQKYERVPKYRRMGSLLNGAGYEPVGNVGRG